MDRIVLLAEIHARAVDFGRTRGVERRDFGSLYVLSEAILVHPLNAMYFHPCPLSIFDQEHYWWVCLRWGYFILRDVGIADGIDCRAAEWRTGGVYAALYVQQQMELARKNSMTFKSDEEFWSHSISRISACHLSLRFF